MRIDEFLLARVAEDEAVARAASGPTWVPGYERDTSKRLPTLVAWLVTLPSPDEFDSLGVGGTVATLTPEHVRDYDHIVRHDPARVLAECEAKRRVVELHAPKDPDPYASWKTPEYHEAQRERWAADHLVYDPSKWWRCAECDHKYPCRTVKHLAAVYADHPDFDPAWRL